MLFIVIWMVEPTFQAGQHSSPVSPHSSGVTLLEGARGQGMAGCPID